MKTCLALQEAGSLLKCNCDGIIVENMADLPYQRPNQRGPETVAIMTEISSEIRRKYCDATIGVQILSGGSCEALAVAAASDLDFIRLESFVFGHIGDEGYTESNAALALRYRKQIGAENVKIFTDIKKKHSSHAITADVDIIDTAIAADFFLSDGLIITGSHTGVAASPDELTAVKDKVNLPVFIGSGITSENIDAFQLADGLIVGSEFKIDGKWQNELDLNRIKKLTKANQ